MGMGLVNQFRILVYWCGGAVMVWIIAYLIGKIRDVRRVEKDQRR